MIKTDKRWVYATLIPLAITGIAIHIVGEHFSVETEYGLRPNPWLSELKLIHNLFNFLFIFIVGKIFNGHIKPGLLLKKKTRIKSGFLLVKAIIFLVISGVLLLYSSDEKVHEILVEIHWILGLILIGSFVYHQLLGLKEK